MATTAIAVGFVVIVATAMTLAFMIVSGDF